MVIIFENEKARKHLLKKGLVYTFRKKKRKQIGNDWMTNKRGGHKVADVTVKEIGCWSGMFIGLWAILKHFSSDSGFSSVEEWVTVITKLHSGLMPEKGWIYGVYIR